MNQQSELKQDQEAWEAGYLVGLAGKTPPTPSGVDGLAFQSGVIEGRGASAKATRPKETARG
jgi:hypothetical protein